MKLANPRKHLTTAQRIRVIEDYIKATFASQGDTTYIVPPTTLPKLAADATSKLGFEVNDNQLTGCFKVMEEMGLSVTRPRVTSNAPSKIAVLRARVEALESRVGELESKVLSLMINAD
jgi:hypothetical protein